MPTITCAEGFRQLYKRRVPKMFYDCAYSESYTDSSSTVTKPFPNRFKSVDKFPPFTSNAAPYNKVREGLDSVI